MSEMIRRMSSTSVKKVNGADSKDVAAATKWLKEYTATTQKAALEKDVALWSSTFVASEYIDMHMNPKNPDDTKTLFNGGACAAFAHCATPLSAMAAKNFAEMVNLGYLKTTDSLQEIVARRISKAAGGPKVIVERSTVPATAGKSMAKILKANSPHAMVVLSNPEFAREGNAMVDHASPERVLIGGPETEAGLAAIEQLAALYCQWVPRDKVITSSLWSAELSKLTQNAFLAQRVSSINSISALCEATGADVDEVSFAVGVDTRIGRKGMTASVGFGGACYETHLRNLVYLASVSRLPQVAKYWQAVINMNEWQKRRFATKVVSAMFNTVSGKKLALLGFAYKKNTSDTRNSAAIDVCRALLTERAQIAVHDPRVAKEAIAVALSDADGAERLLAVEADPYVAIDGSHALLVMTEWDEFKRLDYKRAFSMMQKPAFVFDGRNLLDHAALREIGFIVHGIGKAQPRGPAPKPLIAGGSIGESSPGAPKPAAAAKPAAPLRMDTMGGGA